MKRLAVFELHKGNQRITRNDSDIYGKSIVAAQHLGRNRNTSGVQGVHKQFVVEHQVGCGSSFQIFECSDPVTDEQVLLKILVEDVSPDAELLFEVEVTRLIEQGADYGLCLSSRGRTELGPYYAINGDREAALKFALGSR